MSRKRRNKKRVGDETFEIRTVPMPRAKAALPPEVLYTVDREASRAFIDTVTDKKSTGKVNVRKFDDKVILIFTKMTRKNHLDQIIMLENEIDQMPDFIRPLLLDALGTAHKEKGSCPT